MHEKEIGGGTVSSLLALCLCLYAGLNSVSPQNRRSSVTGIPSDQMTLLMMKCLCLEASTLLHWEGSEIVIAVLTLDLPIKDGGPSTMVDGLARSTLDTGMIPIQCMGEMGRMGVTVHTRKVGVTRLTMASMTVLTGTSKVVKGPVLRDPSAKEVPLGKDQTFTWNITL